MAAPGTTAAAGKPGGGDRHQHKRKPKFQQDRGTKRGAGGGGASGGGASGGGGKPHHHRHQQQQDGPANKKRRTKMERAKAKPAFDLVARAKAIWATFRSKRLGKEEREKLAEELFGLIKGKLHQIAVKHDAARVVQCALLHGSYEQRQAYTAELLEHLLEFAKLQYAHFIILRLLDVTANQPTERKKILRVFAGKAHTLAAHAVGAKVLEGIFSTYPKQDTQALRAELYGRETTLLLAGTVGGGGGDAVCQGQGQEAAKGRDLKAVLAELPDRREKVLGNVLGMVQKMLAKDLVTLPFVQELLWEYVANAGPQAVRDLVPSLLDYLLLLTGTRPGCKVLAECAAYGTPKDRKKMLKALKGYVMPTLLHKDAYLFILRLADVVDDTVAFTKTVWNELLEKNETEASMLRFATHVKASKILLSLLAPAKRTTFLTKEELELLKPAFVPATANANNATTAGEGEGEGEGTEDAAAAAPAAEAEEEKGVEEEGAMVPTSKKDPELRRQELLAPLQAALVQLGKAHALELLCSAEGSFVLYEVAARWRDPALLEAVAKAAASDGEEPEEEEDDDDQGDDEGEDAAEAMDEDKEPAADDNDAQQVGKPSSPSPPAGDGEAAGPPREHRIAYKTIKRLLLLEAGPASPGAEAAAVQPLFAEALYREARGHWLKWLASIRGGFLMEALVKTPRVGPQVLEELRAHEAELAALAGNNLKGAAAVLDIMRAGAGGGKDKAGTPSAAKGKGPKGGGKAASPAAAASGGSGSKPRKQTPRKK